MAFPQMVTLSYGMEKLSTSDKRHPLGVLGLLPDGRIYRYVKNSSTALTVSGTFLMSGITTPRNTQTIPADVAIGGVTLTCGNASSAAVTADEFADGMVVITAGTGAGETYRVKSNTAVSGTSCTVTLEADDAITVRLESTDTDLDLFLNPYSGVKVDDGTAQQATIGLNPMPVTASHYFWAQVKGVSAIKIDNAASASGVELDEKAIVVSVNHAGQGFIVASPVATTVYWGRPVVARLIPEADVTDNEWEFCFLDLL